MPEKHKHVPAKKLTGPKSWQSQDSIAQTEKYQNCKQTSEKIYIKESIGSADLFWRKTGLFNAKSEKKQEKDAKGMST